jgi:hypothetical protein
MLMGLLLVGLLAACARAQTTAPVPTAATLQPSRAALRPTMPAATLVPYPTLPPEWTETPVPPPTFTRTPRPTPTPTLTATETVTPTVTSTSTVTPTPTVTHAATRTPVRSTVATTGTVTPVPGATSTSTMVVVPPVAAGSFELGGQVNDITASTSKMKYAGMAWVKVQDRWSPGATAGGGKIQEAHNQGFKILLSVLGDPSTISGGANFDTYAAYVGQLAKLGADGIEIWNEMNIDREWPAGQINPATYTDLLRRAYTQIKANNSNTLVISGALAPTGAEGAFGPDHVWNDNRYIAGMATAGAASYMDCIGIHYNEGILSPTQSSGDPRQDYYTRYYSGMVSTYYNAFGGGRKLCFTELGYLTPEGYGALPSAFAWAANTTAAEQAQWLGQAASLSMSGGVVRLMVVFNVDFTVWGDDPQAGYAILRPGGSCPACDALRAVTGGR